MHLADAKVFEKGNSKKQDTPAGNTAQPALYTKTRTRTRHSFIKTLSPACYYTKFTLFHCRQEASESER